jgi:hypothetical protein
MNIQNYSLIREMNDEDNNILRNKGGNTKQTVEINPDSAY